MTIKIDRMELADIGHPVLLAKAVLRQLTVAFPIPVYEIALACGIREIKEHTSCSFEGALIADEHKNEGFILVRGDAPLERKRFTVGHELGHLLNQWHQPSNGEFHCTRKDMWARDAAKDRGRAQMETEASRFAAELLMPTDQLRTKTSKSGTNLEDVEKVSSHFGVSQIAAARRLVDLDDSSALVLSHLDRVQYAIRGDQFPWIAPGEGQQLPRTSVSLSYKGKLSGQEEIDCETWLSRQQPEGTTLYEQVLAQGGSYKLTLLVLDKSELDDEDNEVKERSSWNPRFK